MSGSGDDATGLRERSNAVSQAWKQTNEEMRALAEQRREAGWEVVTATAVHTDPVGIEQGTDDRFGLVSIVPDNHADAVDDAFERGDFTRFEAYRNEVEGDAFLVTELLDPERELAVLLASSYDLRRARAMIESARDEGVLYTHAKTLDGTHLGSVRHEEWRPLVPDPDGGAAPPASRQSNDGA